MTRRAVRPRPILAVAALLAGVLVLSGCDGSNVGHAATVDGTRISEQQINDLLTPQAKAVTLGGSSTTSAEPIPPRSFVLDVLIQRKLYAKLLSEVPGGAPNAAQLKTIATAYRQGRSVHSIVAKLGATGYRPALENDIVEIQVLATLVNNAVQKGVDVNALASKLTFPVTVNPRYGSWDRKNFNLTTGRTAGLPGYLQLQAAPSAAAGS